MRYAVLDLAGRIRTIEEFHREDSARVLAEHLAAHGNPYVAVVDLATGARLQFPRDGEDRLLARCLAP